ncbi:DUF3288 family protein [Synechococcus sp. GFB01]|uniref:DUF3288 family protein n=1 Tax=Synechococcus sp. GFB01 TaxID=1662190 RepID=UPI00064E1FBC|nr:DUF3288 family protein [Synechococcus sp. GFB01]KMM16766.1 hypothetical protein SYNGFB01_08775 [Synechococcus sp. GFB01]
MSEQQSHPLHALDRQVVDRLLAAATPADDHLVDAARLLMRYEGFPGASDLQADLHKALRLWGLSREQLQERTRAIWAAGYRPAPLAAAAGAEPVGSGFDTADQDG